MPRLITLVFIVALLSAATGLRFWPVATASAAEVAPPFDWSMLPRHTGTSLVDPNDFAAAREYVKPANGYRVVLDGCPAFTDELSSGFAEVTFTYTITGGALTEPQVVSKSAAPKRLPIAVGGGFEEIDCNAFRIITTLQQGSYTVSLQTATARGYSAVSVPQTIVVKDILIISVGDSYGSGEGAPDSFVKFGLLGYAETPAVWQDQRCHRSAWAGPSQAAAILEQSDPRTSVTFVSLACSGATINTAIDDNPDDGNANGDINWSAYQGAGLLTGYSGIEHDRSYDPASFLPPQMEQAARIAKDREIDALTISGGGNDMHFANVITDCVLSDCSTNTTTANRIANDFIQLEVRYQELADFINNERDTSDVPALDITPDRVFITEYPDPTRDMDGDWCQVNQLDDPLLAFPVTGITAQEMEWASANLVKPMNQAIQNHATYHGWNYVTGIAAEFFGDPANGVPGRGWCALGEDANGEPNNWVNRSVQALGMQGPVTIPLGLFAFYGVLGLGLSIVSSGISLLLTLVSTALLVLELKGTAGTMHPNRMGQMVYARHIAATVQNRFNAVVPQPGDTTPPTIAPAQNIAVETLDAAGAIVNYPIPATTDIVDGQGLASCAPVSGGLFLIGTTPVTCSARDSSGNQATPVNFSVTVALGNGVPTVEIAGPTSVEEGGAVTLTATGSDPEGGELTYAWDLDGDGEYETSGQEATVSAAALDGPTTQSVAVRVTDDAGATAGASLIVEILNATPVVVSGDTQTLDEGSQFAATGSFSDAGMLDTHSATVNYGDGGGDTPLTLNDDRSFALDHTYSDNGTYVATVSVSDDDGATGTAAATIIVSNVAPSVTLGDDATLRRGETLVSSGSFTDPGADDWTATVDYGDGSPTEALTLNADGTFTLAHVYTSAGTFTVSVCVSDDDSGSGCDTLILNVTPYAIFAGRDDCGAGSADAIQWSGSNATLYSDLHSNSGLKVSGSRNSGNGSASYRCQVKVSGSQNTFTSGPDKVTDTRPWPVQMDATAFTCDVTVVGTLDLSKDGVWWVDGTKASQQLAPLTLCAAEIKLSGSNISGTVTLVAEQISLSGSNIRLTAHQHGVLLFATGADTDAIKVSGSKNQLAGDLVARAGGIDLSGSGNQILGALIGWTVKLSGSNWTIDARVTVSP